MRKIRFLIISYLILLHGQMAIASVWSDIHLSVILGHGYTTVGASRQIWLANTPDPGLENDYSSGGLHQNTALLGFALEKSFLTNLNHIESAIGVEADYMKNPTLRGVVRPMVNVAPDFDTLNYSYSMNAYLLLATAKLSILNILPKLGAYLQAGVGGAVNTLSDYAETSPIGSSAAPMLAPFGSASDTSFAYSIGAGVLCQVGKSMRVLLGYRYINSGQGEFNTSPVQQTNSTLHFSPLGHHFLILTVTD